MPRRFTQTNIEISQKLTKIGKADKTNN